MSEIPHSPFRMRACSSRALETRATGLMDYDTVQTRKADDMQLVDHCLQTLHFLDLPSELLVSILSLLPLRDLLAFSHTARAPNILSNYSLRTLSLGIYPCKLAALTRQEVDGIVHDDYSACVCIPDGERSHTHISDCFHDRLISTVLERYSESLRVLELNVWRVSWPVAAALSQLAGLTTLSLRRDEVRWGRKRSDALSAGGDITVWRMLAGSWTRLSVLRLENVHIGEYQLAVLLENNTSLQQLWLRDCQGLGIGVWRFIAEEWRGRDGLKAMEFEGCNVVDDEVVDYIAWMRGLQKLHLSRCTRTARELIYHANREWKIPQLSVWQEKDEFIEDLQMDLIEIDPVYT